MAEINQWLPNICHSLNEGADRLVVCIDTIYDKDGNYKDINTYLGIINSKKKSVTYPGTHDNNTTVGWFIEEVKSDMKVKIAKFLGADVKNPKDVCQKMIELSYASDSCFAIIPMQDVLKLDSSAKMNRPGTVGNNWSWQLTADYLSKVERGQLKALCDKYSR